MLKGRRLTVLLACLTLAVLVLSLPGSLRDAFDRGGIYLFSMAFLEDIPRRLTGPGRFRFILQPSVAIFLGIRSGLATRGWGGRRISTASSSIETLGASC
jgi:hypothetical protein